MREALDAFRLALLSATPARNRRSPRGGFQRAGRRDGHAPRARQSSRAPPRRRRGATTGAVDRRQPEAGWGWSDRRDGARAGAPQSMRRVLDALVEARLTRPGEALSTDAVLAAGRVSASSRCAGPRVYTAIRRLRALGFRERSSRATTATCSPPPWQSRANVSGRGGPRAARVPCACVSSCQAVRGACAAGAPQSRRHDDGLLFHAPLPTLLARPPTAVGPQARLRPRGARCAARLHAPEALATEPAPAVDAAEASAPRLPPPSGRGGGGRDGVYRQLACSAPSPATSDAAPGRVLLASDRRR